MSDQVVVICVPVSAASDVHNKSVISECGFCGRKVWVMPHNITQKKACPSCVESLPGEKTFCVRGVDLREAVKHLHRKGESG